MLQPNVYYSIVLTLPFLKLEYLKVSIQYTLKVKFKISHNKGKGVWLIKVYVYNNK